MTTGPFAHWTLVNPVEGRWVLHRNLTVAPPNARTEPSLMPDEAIEMVTNARTLRDLTWFVDVTFESHHGAVHNWIGGVMGDLPNSPSDPVFFLHHAFIDCLWEQMRSRQRQRVPLVDPRYDYPNDSFALGVGIIQPDGEILTSARRSHHHAENILEPFGPLRNIDGLRNEYFDEFYTCSPSPRCSADNTDCGSAYLFCDRNTFRCAPKLTIGSNCSGFVDSDSCNRGSCCEGTCRRSCSELPGSRVSGSSSIPAPDLSSGNREANPPDQLEESVDTVRVDANSNRRDIRQREPRRPFIGLDADRAPNRIPLSPPRELTPERDPRRDFIRPDRGRERTFRAETRPATAPETRTSQDQRTRFNGPERRPHTERNDRRRFSDTRRPFELRPFGRDLPRFTSPNRNPFISPGEDSFFNNDRFSPFSERTGLNDRRGFAPFDGLFGTPFRLFG